MALAVFGATVRAAEGTAVRTDIVMVADTEGVDTGAVIGAAVGAGRLLTSGSTEALVTEAHAVMALAVGATFRGALHLRAVSTSPGLLALALTLYTL